MKILIVIAIGFFLHVIAQHCDYLYQANLFGWETWWELSKSAPKWGFWDFIPHDSWHFVQFVRNALGWLVAPSMILLGALFFFIDHPKVEKISRRSQWVVVIVLPVATLIVSYMISRGLGFTLVKYLFTGTT